MSTQQPVDDREYIASTLKFRSYVAIGWFVFLTFSMIGIVSGHESIATYLAIGIAVMWVINKIVNDAIDGFMILSILSKTKKKLSDDTYKE